MKSFGKFILYFVLLILGLFVGLNWKGSKLSQLIPIGTSEQHVIAENTQIPKTTIEAAIQSEAKERTIIQDSESATIALFENSAPSVCFITTSNLEMNYWSRNITEIPRGSGSGFIWDNEGHVVTNYHVIKNADRATVTLSDQSTYKAELVGIAPEKDLAVLRINFPGDELIPLPIGSSENLKVGQNVYAIGNPFGLDQTLTKGIISALGREINSQSNIPIRDVIQTDAAINPGNSGGPLLDSAGDLIGVNTAIYSPTGAYAGIGFSIPVDVLKYVIPDLIEYGEVKRPVLGIELLTNPQVARRLKLKGALVINVTKGGGADLAGVQGTIRDQSGNIEWGDIIIGINEDKIESNNDLVYALEKFKAGDQIRVKLLRDDQLIEKEIQLGNK